MGKVIYLTGAPATGKSTLTRGLAERVSNLSIFCYSQQLRDYVNGLEGTSLDEISVREQSSRVITRAHVNAVDALLIKRVENGRRDGHLVIDSHPVTKEQYGFRVTGFSQDKVMQLAPDCVICLYANPEVLRQRISADAQGRPLPTLYELEIHNQTQIGMATLYSVIAGCPCYLVDSATSTPTLIQQTIELAKIA